MRGNYHIILEADTRMYCHSNMRCIAHLKFLNKFQGLSIKNGNDVYYHSNSKSIKRFLFEMTPHYQFTGTSKTIKDKETRSDAITAKRS